MNQLHDDDKDPRWLRLASALRAEPAPGTMARVRARLEQREPLWLTWLARPATLAVSAGLLVASAWFGASLVPAGTAGSSEDTTLAALLLEDDGSFGLSLEGTAVT
ncbi:MAG TPA: hypothetical protein VFX50_11285, partial [Gemmatimonadales bacterium]|nr:hypothetical protein [Gemmatimonadales bacterium]